MPRGVTPLMRQPEDPMEGTYTLPRAASWSLATLLLERQQRRPDQMLVHFVEGHPAPQSHAAAADDREAIAAHGGGWHVGVTETGALAMAGAEGAEWLPPGAARARGTQVPAAPPAGLRGGRAPSRGCTVGPRALPHLGSLQLPRRVAARVQVEDRQVGFLDGIPEKLELEFGLIMTDRQREIGRAHV